MPFVHTGSDPNLEYLSDGITENLISRLSYSPVLKVIALNSVYRYKDLEIDPRLVGSELGVQEILVGKVVQHDTDLSISAELVDTGDGRRVWGERYNHKISDLQFLQSELAQDIADRLRAPLSGDKQVVLTGMRRAYRCVRSRIAPRRSDGWMNECGWRMEDSD